MRVFRQIVVLGVGAAITFSNAGQSAAAPHPAKSPENSPQSDRLQLAPKVESAPNLGSETVSETASDSEQAVAVSPPTAESEPKPASAQPAEVQAQQPLPPTTAELPGKG
ncbi:MAG: TolC family protein, partial [Microcoleus sp.]